MYLGFQCGEIFFHTVVCKSKHVYYDFLVTEKEKFSMVLVTRKKISAYLTLLLLKRFEKLGLSLQKCILQIPHSKILYNIIFTNSRLVRIGYR